MLVLAGPLIATLFNYGAFGEHDVRMASLSLMAYALGLIAFTLVKVLAPGYYSRQDTKTPVRVGVIAMLSNIVLNAAIVLPMVHYGVTGPHAGLALATGIAAALNAGLLYRGLRRSGIYAPGPGWAWLVGRLVVANVIMAGCIAWLAGDLSSWLAAPWHERALRLALCVPDPVLGQQQAAACSPMSPPCWPSACGRTTCSPHPGRRRAEVCG